MRVLFFGLTFFLSFGSLFAEVIGTESCNDLLAELVRQSQYQVGLLAFVGGIVLAFIFVFGMRLR